LPAKLVAQAARFIVDRGVLAEGDAAKAKGLTNIACGKPMSLRLSSESTVVEAENPDLPWCQKINSPFFARLIHPQCAI
jgi:hypothetical protein